MARDFRVSEAMEAFRRGWALTPLRGKKPVNLGWQSAPRPNLAEVVAWAKMGNLGLRTGAVSGIVVIDVDSPKGADDSSLHLPATVTVVTGSGGRHYYFQHRGEPLGNSVGKLAPHVDIRGHGGQVVYVGSIHPETGRVYCWAEGLSPQDMPVAMLPTGIVKALTIPRREIRGHPLESFCSSRRFLAGSSSYGRVAMESETAGVLATPPGGRNDRLNRAAFGLGQLVARGHLHEDEVLWALSRAAEAAGLPTNESFRTIRSGLAAGQRNPR